jgi:hypothetical protein
MTFLHQLLHDTNPCSVNFAFFIDPRQNAASFFYRLIADDSGGIVREKIAKAFAVSSGFHVFLGNHSNVESISKCFRKHF